RAAHEGNHEQRQREEHTDHDPGVVEGLHQCRLAHQRLGEAAHGFVDRTHVMAVEELRWEADEPGGIDVARLQPAAESLGMNWRTLIQDRVDQRDSYGAAEVAHQVEESTSV